MNALALIVVLQAAASPAKHEATVDAVWFAEHPIHGGTSPITIRIEKNTTGVPAVGVIEQTLGGAGNQWRSSTWIAAVVASEVARTPLTDHEFMVKVAGVIDGPSAGMLMTSTMVAILLGYPIRADVTMTGTINPDGSAGPVGGVPVKMKGAAAKGKRVFGYPIGGRLQVDPESGQMVDLQAVAQRLGMTAVEVRDIDDGVFVLTGRHLPKAIAPLDEREMERSPAELAELEERIAHTKQDLAAADSRLKPLIAAPLVQGVVANVVRQRDASVAAGVAAERAGNLESAQMRFLQAAVSDGMAEEGAHAVSLIAAGKMDELAALAQRAQQENDTPLRTRPAKSALGAVRLVQLVQHYLLVQMAVGRGQDALRSGLAALEEAKKTGASPVNAAVAGVAGPLIVAGGLPPLRNVVEEALQHWDQVDRGKPIRHPDRIATLALGYTSAAIATLEAIDSLALEESARKAGVSVERARLAFAAQDDDYRQARDLASYAQRTRGVLALAAAARAYLGSSRLLLKYYSLECHPVGDDKSTKHTVCDATKALRRELELARTGALRAGARAKAAIGVVPTPSKATFLMADGEREGSDDEKLEALSDYWTSSLWSTIAEELGR